MTSLERENNHPPKVLSNALEGTLKVMYPPLKNHTANRVEVGSQFYTMETEGGTVPHRDPRGRSGQNLLQLWTYPLHTPCH